MPISENHSKENMSIEELLQSTFNHETTDLTKNYIGRTKEKFLPYYFRP